MTRLRGAHVLITGGSSGIGLALAHRVLRGGARVSIIGRDRTRLDSAARELAATNRDAASESAVVTCAADVTDQAALADAVAELVDGQGAVDVLVTCAGTAHPGHFELLADDVFREQIAVDYFGTLHAIRIVAPAMIERKRGHVVLVSSTVGIIGVYGYSAYAPAKFAVRGLAETLRSELAPYGIVVACAYPPDTLTPGFERENLLKPAATARISAAITPRSADAVAARIARGIERNRLTITADFQTAALARASGLLGPLIRRTMDRHVRKAGIPGRSP